MTEAIADQFGSVRISFDRIGRSRTQGIAVEPLVIESSDPDVIAEAVYRYARQYLGSRDVEVVVDMDALQVSIFCGFNNGGTGTIEHISPEVWL